MPDYLGKDKELWQFYSLEAKKEVLTNLQKKGDLTTYAALYDATLKQDSSIRGNDNGFTLGDVAQFGGQTDALTQEEREELKQTFEDVKSEKIDTHVVLLISHNPIHCFVFRNNCNTNTLSCTQ